MKIGIQIKTTKHSQNVKHRQQINTINYHINE